MSGADTTDNELKSKLFAVNEKNYGQNYKDHLLEQYKLYVEMADKISSRRSAANTFFLSLNTLLITAVGILSRLGSSFVSFNLLWVVIASIAGILFCWTWHSIIRSYCQLNWGKYKIIHMMEKRLPGAMYEAEWSCLKPKGEARRYKELTTVELWVPRIFGSLYLALAVVGLILTIT
jgi:hypothetical protein